MMRDWHGVDPDHPAPRLEELIPLLRQLVTLDEDVRHDGRFYRCHLATLGDVPPPPGPPPIYVAGVNSRMVRAAGQVADGLVGHPLFSARYVDEVVRPALQEGARRGGRGGAPPIAGYIICSISHDEVLARWEAASQIAFYATVRSYDSIHGMHGFEPEVDRIRDAFSRQDVAGMVSAVSDRMLDQWAVFGTPEVARERYRHTFHGRYETPLMYSPSTFVSRDRLRENLTAITETFGADWASVSDTRPQT